MKSFRQVVLSAAITLSAFTAVIYAGCKDKCGSTTCQNGGTCTSNVCTCPTGYSGNDCATAWSTPYIGTYTCKYTTGGTTGTWQSVVVTDPTDGGYVVDIENFGNSNITVAATVDSLSGGTSQMLIIPSADSSGVTGHGTYSNLVKTNGEITVIYGTTSSHGGGSGGGSYTFVMDKQ